ncbi:Helicase [Klebsormidium nitens]|uniref:DNA 5'-3' helicase FANCJ n=1 Tax=Klebsormidium nitens TaxID=105231 RepID=A0A1Y1HPN3_KLENI|nr:Helicase [Klebsormidium nitens]|eukprot:GAQ79169.1 Helicase [Klebsormidium nitens]
MQSGGGFLPDLNAPPAEEGGVPDLSDKVKQAAKKDASKSIPKIYYATRTHSQVSQVVRELSKTGYRTPMAILAARKHYCTHKTISKRKDINEECKNLLLEPNGCSYNRNMSKVKTHPSLQHGAVNEIHDIEDLVKIGKQVKGCSYFASRALAAEASIVFCPYNYIIDPVIRKAMEMDIKNSIIILDEAHNIEDVAREAASTTVDLVALDEVRLELQKMVHEEGQMETYQPLIDMTEGIISWIEEKSQGLKKDGQERFYNSWFGDRLLVELEGAGVQPQSLSILLSCFQKVSQQAGEAKPGELHVNGQALATLEGLFTSLRFLLSNEARRLNDFCMVLQKLVKRGEGIRGTVWTTELSLWCLNPAVAFEEVAAAARSIVLTSGTLSPMDSFEKELGCKFSVTMEGSHVIDMDRQIWGGAIGVGPNDAVLNASYRSADGAEFQDSLGLAIEECARIVPDGLLIFFPSYKLMEKLSARWKSTGQWKRINKQKPIYSETRGSDDQFEKVLAGYYSTIKKVQKRRAQAASPEEDADPDKNISGAIFLAVCRGKVSEGIDFADGNARAVIVVGIPFPYAMDLQVVFKKQFNTVNQKSRDLQNGDQWYCQQAFRALNQAIGRCIRHRYDFGAVLLFDERFYRASNTQSLSKWLRGSITKYNNFGESMDSLRSFFRRLELDPPKRAPSPPAPAPFAVEPPQGSGKFHPMFNKALESSTGRPLSAKPARSGPGTSAPENDSLDTVETFAEQLLGCRAGPSGAAEAFAERLSGFKAGVPVPDAAGPEGGYVRRYEATQPTRSERRQAKTSPFWNDEGFVEPAAPAPSSSAGKQAETQGHGPVDSLDLETLDALVAECREEESLKATEAGISDRGRQTGKQSEPAVPEVERNQGERESFGPAGCRGPTAPQALQSGMRCGNTGATCSGQPPGDPLEGSAFFGGAGIADADTLGTSISCARCGSEVAAVYSPEVTKTVLQKSFLQGLLERSRSEMGLPLGDAAALSDGRGLGGGLYPVEVLVVNASELGLQGRQGTGSARVEQQSGGKGGGIWVEKDGCVFEPVHCPGCGPGGMSVGAKVLAADKANSYFNGQVFLFPEVILQRPARPPGRHSDPLPGPRPALPRQSFPVLPSPSEHLQPSPFRLDTQPPLSAGPFKPVGNFSPRLDSVPPFFPSVAQDLPPHPESHPQIGRDFATGVCTAPMRGAIADSLQNTKAPVGSPSEALYIPAAHLLPPESLRAGFVPATSKAPAAQTGEAPSGTVDPQRNGQPTPRAPKPLYVARAGARRASLQAGISGRGATILSASEANVLNSGGGGAPAVPEEGGWQTAAREFRGSAETANVMDGRESNAAAAPSIPGATDERSREEGAALPDSRKRSAGRKRKSATRKDEHKRPREVILETDSDEDAVEKGVRSSRRVS